MAPTRVKQNWHLPNWKAQSEKHKQVERWKVVGKYKKLLKREGADAPPAPWHRVAGDEGAESVVRHRAEDDIAARGAGSSARGARENQKSAQQLARQNYEVRQREVEAERAEAVRAEEERRRAKEAAQKRRVELSGKLKKRTRRGQPILSNQVDAILQKLGAV